MIEKLNPEGNSSTRKKYTPAFKAEYVRQVAAGTRQSDVARAQGILPALLGRWQRQALEAAVPSSAERAEIKPLRAALKRVEMARNRLKKSRDQRLLDAQALPTASIVMRYQFIAACPELWPVQVLCHGLAVSTAGYYITRGGAAYRSPLHLGRTRHRRLLRATPADRALAGCGPNDAPKATRWGAMPCAPGGTERAYTL